MKAVPLLAPVRVLAAVGIGIGIGLACAWVELAALPSVLVDLTVYQAAVGRMLAGGSLHSLPPGGGPPFLYPPFGGLALIPSVWLPAPSPEAITLALLASNPVVSGMYFGQVSMPVVTLMVVDQVVGQRWRGLLTGIAGAIKLWPLIMIPHYLLTRLWRAAANSTAGFAVATTLGFVLAPADSLRYWSGGVAMPPVPGWLNKSWWALLNDWGASILASGPLGSR